MLSPLSSFLPPPSSLRRLFLLLRQSLPPPNPSLHDTIISLSFLFHALNMEVVSCKIINSYFCTWFENGKFIIEDLEVRKTIYLLESLMKWMVKQILDLLTGSSVRFFLREVHDDSGAMKCFLPKKKKKDVT